MLMRSRNLIQNLVAVIIVAVLVACTQAGIATPQTFNEKLAYGYSSLATVRTGAASALTAKAISVTDAEQVQRLADEARVALDSAKVISNAGDMTTAFGKLNLANAILGQLQVYLPKPK